MKEVSEVLRNHLNNEKHFNSCDLYELRLKSGVSYYWSESEASVSYDSKIYKGDGPIIVRDKIATNSTVSVDKMTVSISTDERDKIGGVPIMAVAHNGGFDGATLSLKRAFFDEKNHIIGVVSLFTGEVNVKQGGGLTLQLDVKSVVQRLNTEFPGKRYYPQCPYSIYSSECGVDIKQYRKRIKVVSVPATNTITIDSSFSNGYYNAGGIEWINGPLAGQSTQIMDSQNGRIRYMTPADAQPQVGNEAYIYPGCAKTPEECRSKFNNFNRNRATPYVPLKESIR